MDLVVTRFGEDITWINGFKGRKFIYDKSIQGNTPNIGREAHTILTHIITKWDRLGDHTMFLQGSPFEHGFGQATIVPGQLSFLGYERSDNQYGEPHHPGLPLMPVWDAIFATTPPQVFTFAEGAQYMVPSEHIYSNSRAFYQRCLDLLLEAGDDTNNRFGRTQLPWVFERLWPVIFEGGKYGESRSDCPDEPTRLTEAMDEGVGPVYPSP